ncbi:hypothetical protein [Actinomadura sp. WMMA1423]|uniref:hypothetical protein n=1 Tax=Actinomadura sp. WMMA1423 TaxID=2591108 RepID=UPI0011463DFD|nr:hypothetical protein [Actinomadura sp. WMMA1423]
MGLGFKTFAVGEVLGAADVNGYLMRQTIPAFSSSAAIIAGITSPETGQHAVARDTGKLWYYDGTAWRPTWQSGIQLVSFSSKTKHSLVVNFPTAFGAAPSMCVNIATGAGATEMWVARITEISATNFTIFVFSTNGSTGTWTNIEVEWLAFRK